MGKIDWLCTLCAEVCTNRGIQLEKDGNALGENDSPVTGVFKQREELNV